MEIEAVILPPGESSIKDVYSKDGKDYFLQEEHALVGANLVGKPLLDDHDHSKVIGTITGFRMDQGTKQLHVSAFIPENTTEQKKIHERILSGDLKDVSMGHLFFDGKGAKTDQIIPHEVSVCTEGRRDGTHIQRVRILKSSELAKKYQSNFIPAFETTRPITIVASKNKTVNNNNNTPTSRKMSDIDTSATTTTTTGKIANVDEELNAIKIAQKYKEENDALLARLAEFEKIKAEEESRKADEAAQKFKASAEQLVNLSEDQAERDQMAAGLTALAGTCGSNANALLETSRVFELVHASATKFSREREMREKEAAVKTALASLSQPPSQRIAGIAQSISRAPLTVDSAPVAVTASKRSAEEAGMNSNPLLSFVNGLKNKKAPSEREYAEYTKRLGGF